MAIDLLKDPRDTDLCSGITSLPPCFRFTVGSVPTTTYGMRISVVMAVTKVYSVTRVIAGAAVLSIIYLLLVSCLYLIRAFGPVIGGLVPVMVAIREHRYRILVDSQSGLWSFA